MTLHAVDDIGDAIDATKSFVLPFELGTWLRLAFVVFFIGGGGGTGGVQNLSNLGDMGGGGGGGGTGGSGGFGATAPLESLPAVTDGLARLTLPGGLLQTGGPGPGLPPGAAEALAGFGLLTLLVVVLVVVALVVVFAVLGALMEFVFVQSLVDREVHVRRYARDHLGNGLRLLGFRIVVGLAMLVVFGGLALALFLAVLGGSATDLGASVILGSFGLFVLLLVVAAVVGGTINGFTNVFVVPLMVDDDDGVVASWQRLLDSLTDHPKQYLAYLALSVVLGIGVGIVGAVLGVVAAIVLLIPFGGLALVFWFALGQGLLAGVLAGISLAAFALVLLVVANLIKAPLLAFLRYYAMLVLGDIDADLDPIPEVRADVRG
ncbi:DUF7544 domain-containing protein [Haloarcula litorea]|uniref:DUF7544 domain-containing protein n=1 Tax=Haloarcula litorea TaxID=3032579 RepID=UPI0023E7DBC0|nr:hypothetical protein [Halomicroarcula sp. GDY20]